MFAVARELDKRHKSNLAKYYYGLALSEFVQEANKLALPSDGIEFSQYIGELNEVLSSTGLSDEIIALLQKGQLRLAESGDLPMDEFPPVYVSTETGELALTEQYESMWFSFARTTLLRPLEPEIAIEILRSGPEIISDMLFDEPEETFTCISSTDEWSIMTLLEHMILGETLLHGRAQLILTEDEPVLEYLPVDLSDDKYGNSPFEVVQRYQGDRMRTLTLLDGAPEPDWYLRSGYHTIYGQLTLQDHVSFFARYECENIQRIKNVLAACRAIAKGDMNCQTE